MNKKNLCQSKKYNIEVLKKSTKLIVGPVLLQYIMWIIREAQKDKITTLYFLARDGYFMHQYASELCEKYKIPIDCHYLYCSRYSLRIPSYHLDEIKALEYICLGGKELNFIKILQRAGLTQNECKIVSNDMGMPLERQLTYQEVQAMKVTLKESTVFMNYMLKHSRESYRYCIEYLKQEGLMKLDGVAIVDSGWTGSMQYTLAKLLGSVGGETSMLRGYYFGMYHSVKGHEDQYKTYFFSNRKSFMNKVNFNNNLFEAIYGAPHPMTESYEWSEDKQKVIPKFFAKENPNKRFIEIEEVYLTEYLNNILKETTIDNLYGYIDRKDFLKLMKRLMMHPTDEEIYIYGSLMFSDDTSEHTVYQLAEPLTEEELKKISILARVASKIGKHHKIIKEPVWIEGSIARLPDDIQKRYIRQVSLYKYLLYIKKGISG